MIKKITWLLSLSLFSLMVFVHQEAGAEETKKELNPENIAVKKEIPTIDGNITIGKARTVVIVRHAEKVDGSTDSPLTKAGECRAESLAKMLNGSGISIVFSTKFPTNEPVKRTQETINNYANSQTPPIAIQYYDYSDQGIQNLATLIKSPPYSGKSILVASHSNMVEQLVQNLGAGSVPAIGNEFNNLFIVTIPPLGTPSVMKMKYESWPFVLSQSCCCE